MSQLDNLKPCSCSCDLCKSMCQNPCIPTPQEAIDLIKSGKAKHLELLGKYNGITFVDLLLPKRILHRRKNHRYGCIFWTAKGLCKLHNTGLKPLEGKLTSHNMKNEDGWILHYGIVDLWNSEEGRNAIELYKSTIKLPQSSIDD